MNRRLLLLVALGAGFAATGCLDTFRPDTHSTRATAGAPAPGAPQNAARTSEVTGTGASESPRSARAAFGPDRDPMSFPDARSGRDASWRRPIHEDFRTPEAVLATMQRAIESKSASGSRAWLDALAESTRADERAYRAFYDAAVKQGWQATTAIQAPEPWDLGLERGLMSFMPGIRQAYQYAWQWSADLAAENDGDPTVADTVQFHRKYRLVATSPDGRFTDLIAIGSCDLSFRKSRGRWSVYRWNDHVDPDVGVNPVNLDERCMSWWRLESLAR